LWGRIRLGPDCLSNPTPSFFTLTHNCFEKSSQYFFDVVRWIVLALGQKGEKMQNVQVDLLTVLIAALLSMVIGFFWYSKWLFGPTWMKENRIREDEEHHRSRMSIVYAFLVALVTAYFLAMLEGCMGVTTVTDGMFIGFITWLGFVVTTQLSTVIWGKTTFRGFVVDTCYKLLSFLVMSGVIGA
jgi:hypothetical protein